MFSGDMTRALSPGRDHVRQRSYFLDMSWCQAPLPGWSGPAELGEAILVDAEVVGDLVQDGDADLVLEDVRVVAELLLERDTVDGNLVREHPGVALDPAVDERDAEVEPEEVRVLCVLVLHD